MVVKRLRVLLRRSRRAPDGKYAQSIGLRLGYWPCLGGPFVSIHFGSRRLDLWYGRESYL